MLPLAVHRGVHEGMSLAQARALLGKVQVQPYEPVRDAAALEAWARWALRWAPKATVDGTDALLLEVTGCRRLYGGEDQLLKEVRQATAKLDFASRAAIAPHCRYR